MFNNDDYDYRKMPKLFELTWIVKYTDKGINLNLDRVIIQYGEKMNPRPYWKNGGKDHEDTEHFEWVPLHCDYHKGGMIATPVLGVHFNFAIKWFTENILKGVTASYPIDLVNDLDGSYDISRV